MQSIREQIKGIKKKLVGEKRNTQPVKHLGAIRLDDNEPEKVIEKQKPTVRARRIAVKYKKRTSLASAELQRDRADEEQTSKSNNSATSVVKARTNTKRSASKKKSTRRVKSKKNKSRKRKAQAISQPPTSTHLLEPNRIFNNKKKPNYSVASSGEASTSQSTFPINEQYLHSLSLADTYAQRSPAISDWIISGLPIQYDSSQKNTTPVPVTIGIDFGTSYTKVAIRLRDTVFYINFSDNVEHIDGYLLPSALYTQQDRVCTIFKPSRYIKSYSGLKSDILTNEAKPDVNPETCVYISLIMRYTRAWMYKNKTIGNILKYASIIWNINIGCPTGSTNSNGNLETLLTELAETAWELSTRKNLVSNDAIEFDSAKNTNLFEQYSLNEVAVVPEFAAQIIGYANSSKMSEELHLLCDIGAGTVDISVFNIVDVSRRNHERDEDLTLPIFSSRVITRGTHVLMTNRLANIGISEFTWKDRIGIPNVQEMVSEHDCNPQRIEEVDMAISESVMNEVNRQMHFVKKEMDPRADAWKPGNSLKLFMCGGGASCSVYKEIFHKLQSRRVQRFDDTEIGMNLTTLSASQQKMKGLHRLSVASGLTQDFEDIIIRPSDQIERIPVTKPTRTELDRDDLYPK